MNITISINLIFGGMKVMMCLTKIDPSILLIKLKNKDTLSIIFNFLDHQTLCTAVRVDKLWHKIGVVQLESRYKVDAMLPILHNRMIKGLFIDCLCNMFAHYKNKYHEYMHFSHVINLSYIHKIRSHLFPYTSEHINLLYSHVLTKLNIVIDANASPNRYHKFWKKHHDKNKSCQIGKCFAILLYLKNSLTTVVIDYYDDDIVQLELKYYIHWSAFLINDDIIIKN